ncbi:unnamed protein product, partial [marine sediment metagenome]
MFFIIFRIFINLIVDFINPNLEKLLMFLISHSNIIDELLSGLDTPIILKSELHNGIQIVDSVAFLIHRYTRKKLDGN